LGLGLGRKARTEKKILYPMWRGEEEKATGRGKALLLLFVLWACLTEGNERESSAEHPSKDAHLFVKHGDLSYSTSVLLELSR